MCFSKIIEIMGSFASVGLFVVAWVQLTALNKQKKAEFLYQFKKDFFESDRNQKIIKLTEEQKFILETNGGEFDEYDIDEYLDTFDVASNFWKKDLIDLNLFDEVMGNYVTMAWKNSEIRNYIEKLRKDKKDASYYKPFQEIAEELILREQCQQRLFR